MVYLVISALIIGLSLGLLGSGGSILTLPVLIYLIGMPEQQAIAAALLIVGVVSATACIPRFSLIDWKVILLFSVPAMVGSASGAVIGLWLPTFFQILMFCMLMLLSAWRMFQSSAYPSVTTTKGIAKAKLMFVGAGVGVITGMVGVGGGFLIVPALLLIAHLPLAIATSSSLVIIALQSSIGFITYWFGYSDAAIVWPWSELIAIAVIGSIASLLGYYFANRLPKQRIQQIFALSLVFIAISMLFSLVLSFKEFV